MKVRYIFGILVLTSLFATVERVRCYEPDPSTDKYKNLEEPAAKAAPEAAETEEVAPAEEIAAEEVAPVAEEEAEAPEEAEATPAEEEEEAISLTLFGSYPVSWQEVDRSGESVTFKWLEPDDVTEKFCHEFIEMYTNSYGHLYGIEETRKDVSEEFLRPDFIDGFKKGLRAENVYFMTIIVNGRLAGYASFTKAPDESNKIWLAAIAISAEFQGRGLMRPLVFSILRRLQNTKSIILVVDMTVVEGKPRNQKAYDLYKRFGFGDHNPTVEEIRYFEEEQEPSITKTAFLIWINPSYRASIGEATKYFKRII